MGMAKETRSIKVLSVCTHENSGGASIAAHRIHAAVNNVHGDVESVMFVKNRSTSDTTIKCVSDFVPHHILYRSYRWLLEKISNKYWHALWRPYRTTNDSNFKSDLRGVYVGDVFQRMEYDILHLHWINQRFLKLRDIPNNKPIIWTLHDSWQFCGECHYFLDCENYKNECGCCPQLGSKNPNDLSHKIWKAKKKCYANKNITIVCPSRWLADAAASSSLFKGCDIRVIPNCLDTDTFRPMPSSQCIRNLSAHQQISEEILSAVAEKENRPLILYGAVNAAKDRIKGFAHLLAALQILDEKGYQANLVVFGANKTDLPLCFKNIKVHFVGYVNDTALLVSLYNLADVMVVPSLTEVFGQTASESMACGTPVVAFRCTGIQDVVGKDGGYLAEPYNDEDLALGIERVVQLNKNKAMSEVVRNSAVERFSIPVVAKQYAELYREVAKKYDVCEYVTIDNNNC